MRSGSGLRASGIDADRIFPSVAEDEPKICLIVLGEGGAGKDVTLKEGLKAPVAQPRASFYNTHYVAGG
jgi:hypothetical protein